MALGAVQQRELLAGYAGPEAEVWGLGGVRRDAGAVLGRGILRLGGLERGKGSLWVAYRPTKCWGPESLVRFVLSATSVFPGDFCFEYCKDSLEVWSE